MPIPISITRLGISCAARCCCINSASQRAVVVLNVIHDTAPYFIRTDVGTDSLVVLQRKVGQVTRVWQDQGEEVIQLVEQPYLSCNMAPNLVEINAYIPFCLPYSPPIQLHTLSLIHNPILYIELG